MKQIFVKQLFIHPIKGLTPQAQESVFLKVGHGIPGDRAFALMYRQDTLNMHTEVPWMRKHHFAMQNNWHSLAALDCFYEPTSGILTVKRKEIELLVADTNTTSGRNDISKFFTGYLAASCPSADNNQWVPLQLVGDYSRTRYPDREAGHISLVSQATIDDLSTVTGKQIDVRRFRPNIVVEGIPAWSEFDWVGKQIQIGSTCIQITTRINRCLNIEVNPKTGERDIPLLSLLNKHYQHTQTGVVGIVTNSGNVTNKELITIQ